MNLRSLTKRIFKTRSQLWFTIFGLVCFGIATAVEFNRSATATDPHGGFFATLVNLLADAGLVLIVAAIVEGTLLTEVDKKANERTAQLSEKVRLDIDKFFRDEFDLLRYSQQYSTHLLPPRRSLRRNVGVTLGRVAAAIERADMIDVMATSGLDFFPPTASAQPPIPKALNQRIQSKKGCKFRLLVCDENSPYTLARGTLEHPHNPNYIRDDIEIARREFQAFKARVEELRKPGLGFGDFTVTRHTYDFMPQGWFVLTEKEVFFEPYHFGRGEKDSDDTSHCFGGRVPIIHATADSQYWKALKDYFDFLVTEQIEPDRVTLRRDYFGIERSKDAALDQTQGLTRAPGGGEAAVAPEKPAHSSVGA